MQNGNDLDMERLWTNRGYRRVLQTGLGLLISSNMVRLRGTRPRGTNLHKAIRLRRVFDDNLFILFKRWPCSARDGPPGKLKRHSISRFRRKLRYPADEESNARLDGPSAFRRAIRNKACVSE